MKSIYCRGNTIIKRFRSCSENVKVKLFKAYCTSFYCMCLWTKYNVAKSVSKVKVAYNRVFRNLFQIRDQRVTSENMCRLNIGHYNVIERKLVFSLRNRVLSTNNELIQTIVSSLFFQTSQMNQRWNKALFNL